jgi:hypothetical protein
MADVVHRSSAWWAPLPPATPACVAGGGGVHFLCPGSRPRPCGDRMAKVSGKQNASIKKLSQLFEYIRSNPGHRATASWVQFLVKDTSFGPCSLSRAATYKRIAFRAPPEVIKLLDSGQLSLGTADQICLVEFRELRPLLAAAVLAGREDVHSGDSPPRTSRNSRPLTTGQASRLRERLTVEYRYRQVVKSDRPSQIDSDIHKLREILKAAERHEFHMSLLPVRVEFTPTPKRAGHTGKPRMSATVVTFVIYPVVPPPAKSRRPRINSIL